MLLYYITDRTQFPGDEVARRRLLLDKIAEAASAGLDYIQIREKDLSSHELEKLADAAVQAVRGNSQTRVLINSRSDVALACGADGVHLRSDDISPAQARALWTTRAANGRQEGAPVIAVSCHTLSDVAQAACERASFAVFAPVFEKKMDLNTHPTGLEPLRDACLQKIPVFALGGITLQNARACAHAGAAGVAGIRLFQENVVARVVQELRGH